MATHTRPRTLIARLGVLTITVAFLPVPGAEALPGGSADHFAGSRITNHEGRDRTARHPPRSEGSVPGTDVSSYQGDVDRADSSTSDGGGWSRDGETLPGAVDLEHNPYGDTCCGLSQAGMGSWVRAFDDRLFQRTGRHPAIYTSTGW